jgi:hypothetical protein
MGGYDPVFGADVSGKDVWHCENNAWVYRVGIHTAFGATAVRE